MPWRNRIPILWFAFFFLNYPSVEDYDLMKLPCLYMLPLSIQFMTLQVLTQFCCLLITIANRFYPDQNLQNVGIDLYPNCLTL